MNNKISYDSLDVWSTCFTKHEHNRYNKRQYFVWMNGLPNEWTLHIISFIRVVTHPPIIAQSSLASTAPKVKHFYSCKRGVVNVHIIRRLWYHSSCQPWHRNYHKIIRTFTALLCKLPSHTHPHTHLGLPVVSFGVYFIMKMVGLVSDRHGTWGDNCTDKLAHYMLW